jgi:hypothetical protein
MGKASSAKKVARAARSGGSSSKKRPHLAFPLAIFAVVVLGALVVVYARVDHTNTANADVKPSYVSGDHWHAAYGIYVCDKFLAPQVDLDPDPAKDVLGIHTHGDGLIHIHPYKASSSGENARLKVWGKDVGIEFSNDGWKMPDGTEYRNGSAKCGDQPAKTAIYKWKADDPSAGVEVFESNYGDINFTEDRDIYTFAVLPQDWPADKLPPQPESVSALANPTAAEGGSPTGDASGLPSDPTGQLGGASSGAGTGGVPVSAP